MPSEFDSFAEGFVAPEMEAQFRERDSEGELNEESVEIVQPKEDSGVSVPAIVGPVAQGEREGASIFGGVASEGSERTRIVTFRTSELAEKKAKVAIGVSLTIEGEAWPVRRINHEGPVWVVVEVVRKVEHRGPHTGGRR